MQAEIDDAQGKVAAYVRQHATYPGAAGRPHSVAQAAGARARATHGPSRLAQAWPAGHARARGARRRTNTGEEAADDDGAAKTQETTT